MNLTLAFSIFNLILNEVTRAQHVLLGAAAPRLAIAIELTTNDDDDPLISASPPLIALPSRFLPSILLSSDVYADRSHH